MSEELNDDFARLVDLMGAKRDHLEASSAGWIRSNHPYAFRSGKWARILTIVPSEGRDCYLVEFPDGKTDWWVVDDPAAEYEFSDSEPVSEQPK